MIVREKPRADDEIALAALDLMRRGFSSSEIGSRLGRGPTFARILRGRVMAADIAESGEDKARVAAAYGQCRHG